jgi:hypothetical protein
MPYWTRIRPGKQPGDNRALANFQLRARYLRLAREITIVTTRPSDYVPPLLRQLARQAQNHAFWSDHMPYLDELPF